MKGCGKCSQLIPMDSSNSVENKKSANEHLLQTMRLQQLYNP